MTTWGAGVIGFLIGAVVVWVVDAIDNAPEGWQDERGFHYGRRPAMPMIDGETGEEVTDLAEWAERERPR